MEPITAQEIRLLAHYGFKTRLGTVVNSLLSYQYAKRVFEESQQRLAVGLEAKAELEARSEAMDPQVADHLFREVRQQLARDQERFARMSQMLRDKTDDLFDNAGAAAPYLASAMGESDYQLTRSQVLDRLEAGISA